MSRTNRPGAWRAGGRSEFGVALLVQEPESGFRVGALEQFARQPTAAKPGKRGDILNRPGVVVCCQRAGEKVGPALPEYLPLRLIPAQILHHLRQDLLRERIALCGAKGRQGRGRPRVGE